MAKTHWKKLVNPDYLGAYAMEPGKDIIGTIKTVGRETVVGTDGKREECTVIHFAEPIKPMIVNRTNAKTISKIYKTPYIEDWEGKRIQVYATSVRAFGELVEALRVRPFLPETKADAALVCADCKKAIADTDKMTAVQIADYTQRRYGVLLCAACAHKREEKKEESGNG